MSRPAPATFPGRGHENGPGVRSILDVSGRKAENSASRSNGAPERPDTDTGQGYGTAGLMRKDIPAWFRVD